MRGKRKKKTAAGVAARGRKEKSKEFATSKRRQGKGLCAPIPQKKGTENTTGQAKEKKKWIASLSISEVSHAGRQTTVEELIGVKPSEKRKKREPLPFRKRLEKRRDEFQRRCLNFECARKGKGR